MFVCLGRRYLHSDMFRLQRINISNSSKASYNLRYNKCQSFRLNECNKLVHMLTERQFISTYQQYKRRRFPVKESDNPIDDYKKLIKQTSSELEYTEIRDIDIKEYRTMKMTIGYNTHYILIPIAMPKRI